jgi:hypothetical protein
MNIKAILVALIISTNLSAQKPAPASDPSEFLSAEYCIDADTIAGTPVAVRILGMLARSFYHYPLYRSTLQEARNSGLTVHSFCMSYGALAVLHGGSIHVNIGMDEYLETSPGMTLIGSGRILREETIKAKGLLTSIDLDRRANTMIAVAVHADSWAQSIAASIEMALYFKRERSFSEVNKPGVLWSGTRVTDVIGPITQYFVDGAKSLSEEHKNQISKKIFERFFTDLRLVNYIATLQTQNAPDGTPFDAATVLAPLGAYLMGYDFAGKFPLK